MYRIYFKKLSCSSHHRAREEAKISKTRKFYLKVQYLAPHPLVLLIKTQEMMYIIKKNKLSGYGNYMTEHCPSAIFPDKFDKSGSPSPPAIIPSGNIPAPIFGIIGIPFSSNLSPGAKSLIISAGGCP